MVGYDAGGGRGSDVGGAGVMLLVVAGVVMLGVVLLPVYYSVYIYV